MARSVSTTTILNVFKVFVYFQVALFITLTRGYFISTSSFRLTLFVTVLVLTFLSPAHAEKGLSLFEFFLTILTSTSSFVISESPVIAILILTDPSLISNIKPRLERFLVNRSSSSSTSLVTSNNIGLEPNGPLAPIWSKLPEDMIGEIIGNQMHKFKDISAILTICNPCSSACLETTSWSLFPWLMLSDKLDSDLRCFINLCNNKCYLLKLPTIHEKRCWGSPLGWVVTLGADYVSHLVHLNERKLIDLPPLDTVRGLAGIDLEWFRLVHKFILFKYPSRNLSFLVIAIFGPMDSLAFTRVGEGAALNRRGQGEWVVVANPKNLKFKDVACFNDQMYAICDHGKLGRFTIDDPESAEVEVISPPPEDLWEWELQKLYLVGTTKNLFSVFRYGHVDPLTSHKGHKTTSFLVYKFNFNASAWEEVTDLEDHAVFVGDGNSWCCPTSTIPSRSNCIFFTDDIWEWYMHQGVAYGGSDVGVFNMKACSFKSLTSREDNPRFYSRITFVIPTVCLN